MSEYNFKVVAELKSSLTDEQKETVVKKIEDLQTKLNIINFKDNEYCKTQPITNYNDFGAVCGFFYELKKMQECFSKLAYYDLWEGEVKVAV